MSDENLSNNQEKFFFNMNIFDEDHVDESELEEEIPPPPTFSEAELAAARKQAFDEGKQQGIDETKQSRSELVALTLEKISQSMEQITSVEEKREKIFEQESVSLSAAIFKKLFPLYSEKFGQEELKDNLKTILESQHGAHKITVKVAPDVVEGVQKLLSELSSKGLNVAFTVTGDENLSQNACLLSWTDGGAVINRDETVQKIHAIMDQRLAGMDSKGHDEAKNSQEDTGTQPVETKDNTSAEKNDTIEAENVEKPDE